MALTLVELRQRLAAKFNEVDLLEILNIRADQLVEAFADKIEEQQDTLSRLFEEDDEFSHQDYQN